METCCPVPLAAISVNPLLLNVLYHPTSCIFVVQAATTDRGINSKPEGVL